MDLTRNLRERRVPQFLSAYVAIGWGLTQFLAFLEGRMGFSPTIVNLLSLALICLLPGVIVLAWRQGRPGPDGWGRVEVLSIATNLLLTAAVLFFVFQGQDFHAVTETVTLTDENGEAVERTVVNGAYRRHLLVFYLDNKGPAQDDWLQQGLTTAIATDLAQNPGLDIEMPMHRMASLRQMGFEMGLDLPRPLQRKIAQDAHASYYVSGSLHRDDDNLVVDIDLYDTDKGTILARHHASGPDMFVLADGVTVFLMNHLDLPAYLLEAMPDQPVADLITDNIEAYRAFVSAYVMVWHERRWTEAGQAIQRAVELDPTFALAHFFGFGIHFTNGDLEKAENASRESMKYLYRVDERSQYQIKSLYYFNVKKDPDKAMAVAEMWARLYSGDVMAQQQIVQFAVMRGEISKALRAYDRILEIDDSQHEVLQKAAKLLRMEGRFEEAEEKLLRYAELYPEEVRSYARLVDLYEDMGALDKAKAAVEQSLLIEPDDQATMLQLANLEKKLGRFEEMERILTQVLENDPVGMVHANALGAWASLQQSRGQWRAARATYDQWRQVAARAGMHPSQATSSYASSISRLATIAAAPAILAELEALRQDLTPPNDQVLGLCRAQVRVVQGQPDQALVDLAETEEFIELYKIEILRSSALMIRGLIAEVDGRHDEAADFMQQATELTPTSTLITIALGRTQRKAGRLADARETLATALRGDPGNPEIKWQLGLTLRALGRGEEGDRYLREAAEVWRDADADHPGATELRELGFGI